ncbi:unnamed protein product [Mytilus coruscus]|uniref:Uncharacterized protein n=1 Tax=Mytilus coruscus TaxID=42192 RepID=A0A6J8AP25_MYTCO|nr:unnamed protein product [Mytilus coruscus]
MRLRQAMFTLFTGGNSTFITMLFSPDQTVHYSTRLNETETGHEFMEVTVPSLLLFYPPNSPYSTMRLDRPRVYWRLNETETGHEFTGVHYSTRLNETETGHEFTGGHSTIYNVNLHYSTRLNETETGHEFTGGNSTFITMLFSPDQTVHYSTMRMRLLLEVTVPSLQCYSLLYQTVHLRLNETETGHEFTGVHYSLNETETGHEFTGGHSTIITMLFSTDQPVHYSTRLNETETGHEFTGGNSTFITMLFSPDQTVHYSTMRLRQAMSLLEVTVPSLQCYSLLTKQSTTVPD